MTIREFDASASGTRRAFSTFERGRRPITRVAWLLARFIRREPVSFERYERCFGGSIHALRGDLATLRRAGISRAGKRLGA